MGGAFYFRNVRFEKMPTPTGHMFQMPVNKTVFFLKMTTPGVSNRCKMECFEKSSILEQFSHFKSIEPATLMIVWHKWEDRSWKASMNAFNFSLTPWHCCHVMVQAVGKPYLSISIPRWQNHRFPDPNLTPLPTHPGMKYFRKGNSRCWFSYDVRVIFGFI